MKKFYKALKIILWVVIGLYAALCIYQVADYLINPEPYMYTSAPWYLGLLIFAVPAVFVIVVDLIVMFFVRRSIKKSEDK